MNPKMLSSYIALLLLFFPATILGAGFEIPELGTRSVARGGASAASVSEPNAAVINPGALSRVKGIMFQYNHNLLWVDSSFQRMDPANEGEFLSPSENQTPFFPLGILASLSYDLGTEHSVIAFTVNGPNTTGHSDFKGSESSRYLLNELDTLLIYYGLSYAYGTEDFGLGVTAQLVQVPRLNFAITVDAMPLANGPVAPLKSPFDVDTELQLEDKGTITGIIGGWWRPTRNIDLAISTRPLPIRLSPKGKAAVSIPEVLASQLEISETKASLTLDLPAHLRLGVRYRHLEGDNEIFDLEFNALFEQWSALEKYDAQLDGTVTANLPGIGTLELQDVVIQKNWEDTVSLRFGGSYWVVPKTVELSAGGFWESAAAPQEYAHLDFPADERTGYGLGASWYLGNTDGVKNGGSKVGLNIAFSEVFQRDISVGSGEGRVYQQRPLRPCPENCNDSLGIAVNEGQFKTQWRTLSVGLTLQGL